MKISVFGSGYVGLVTAVCFAEMGNHVYCVDINAERVARLQEGHNPLYEPGLAELLKKNLLEHRIIFTTDAQKAVAHGEIVFIAVGTPPLADGSADLRHVLSVAKTIGQEMTQYRVVVNKSTVPVGTAKQVSETIAQALAKRQERIAYDVVSNPEFLKEGAAVSDFMKPDRIILGSESERAIGLLKALYAPFNRNHDKVQVMNACSAELTKYAANAMLAAKISLMNELSQIAERVGADIEQVRQGIGADERIGYAFIYPGCGYGGSCFPKDVQALIHTAYHEGYVPQILKAVHAVNEAQKRTLFEKINSYFEGQLKGKTIGVWGLSFKPNTDDIREAPSVVLIESLLAAGASVRAYDPRANHSELSRKFSTALFSRFSHAYEACEGADALAIMTEWLEFRSPDFERMRALLRQPIIFDGRNLYDPDYVKQQGFHYYSIGRKA